MKLTTILIFLFIAVKIPLLAQVKVISGNVTDINNQPISNVLVMGNGTDSVYTDSKGKYKITIKDTVSILLYTKVGYYIHSEEIQNRDVVNVKIDGLELVELSLKELLQVNVSTVSLSTQRIIDAPGIVSVITREDLKYLGIRTIREALTLVAGFSPLQNDDEQILAVRGIFATTNQKILVMRDGHSLNEANIDLPQTDYSLSIENIKKIEIIRGPGASIYGNSALAAVVNIITMEEETTSVKVGAGNYGQFNVDFVSTNKTSGNGFFSTFGRFAGTNGQSFDVPVEITQHYSYPGTYKTNHYPTNFDLGFKYKFKSVYSSFSARSHNYRTYWTAQGYYTNVDSLLAKPGLKQESYHFDFRWEPKISDNIRLNLQHYADYSKLTNYRLLGRIDSIKYTKGYTQLNEWNVFKSGLNYYTIWQYSAQGSLLGGIALEQRRYLESWLASNETTPLSIVFLNKPFFPKNNELRAAGFFQMQHPLTGWLKLDCGARYDWAENYSATFNPRIALIANINNHLTVKAIYTEAFQSPGYSYRTSNASFSGSIKPLNPEKMTTYQASVRYEFLKTSFIEVTASRNYLSNLITRIGTNQKYYANVGKYASYGFEAEGQHNTKILSTFVNYSFISPITSYLDNTFIFNNIYNYDFKHFPKHTINSGIVYHLKDKYHFSLYSQYASGFRTINNNVVNQRNILNSTITMEKLVKNFEFQLSIYNLTNKLYKLGDPSVLPMEQPGRWAMVSVIYFILNK